MTTQTQNAKEKTAESVCAHSPLNCEGKLQQECWANFAVEYVAGDSIAILQKGQFLPVWQKLNGRPWRMATPCQVTVTSALVMGGRYMIKAGDNKLGSHPKIEDWYDSPVRGMGAELRAPGGFRRIKPGSFPALVPAPSGFQKRVMTAKAFHDNFSEAALFEGCPIEIVVRADNPPSELPYTATVMYDLFRKELTTGYILPLPIILSNEEDVVLKDYSEKWPEALKAFCQLFGITEVGLLYKSRGEEPVEDISDERPNEVFRSALSKHDLGFSTLDPELYERMLPFNGAQLDPEFLPKVQG